MPAAAPAGAFPSTPAPGSSATTACTTLALLPNRAAQLPDVGGLRYKGNNGMPGKKGDKQTPPALNPFIMQVLLCWLQAPAQLLPHPRPHSQHVRPCYDIKNTG